MSFLRRWTSDRAAEITARLNRRMDSTARTTIVVGGRRLPAFRVCGIAGYAAGVLAGSALAAAHGRAVWLVLVLSAVAAATFFVLSACARGQDGGVRLVAYHHQVAVLAMTTVTLLLAGARVPGYLDSVAIGLGVFLAFGRIGCLMVGCCHGRPAAVGTSSKASLRTAWVRVCCRSRRSSRPGRSSRSAQAWRRRGAGRAPGRPPTALRTRPGDSGSSTSAATARGHISQRCLRLSGHRWL